MYVPSFMMQPVLDREAVIRAVAIEISINQRFLMEPIKSVSMVLGMGSKISTPRAGHQCGDCSRTNCSRRV